MQVNCNSMNSCVAHFVKIKNGRIEKIIIIRCNVEACSITLIELLSRIEMRYNDFFIKKIK